MEVILHTMCYQRQAIFQILIQWLLQREKIFPSCAPIYSKLKNYLVIKKVGKNKDQIFNKFHIYDQPTNLHEKLYLIFIRREAKGV